MKSASKPSWTQGLDPLDNPLCDRQSDPQIGRVEQRVNVAGADLGMTQHDLTLPPLRFPDPGPGDL